MDHICNDIGSYLDDDADDMRSEIEFGGSAIRTQRQGNIVFCSGETCFFSWQSKGQPFVTCKICKAGTF